LLVPFRDQHDTEVNHSIDDLAKAIARELMKGLRNSAVVEAVANREGSLFQAGPLTVDTLRHEVTWQGEQVSLKPREFALLAFLVQNAGIAFTRDQLLDLVWPADAACEIDSNRTVDVHIRRIRIKLGQEAAQLIRTIAGVGYKLQGSRGERP
jgi:DNA-binding response OmpR family regulator